MNKLYRMLIDNYVILVLGGRRTIDEVPEMAFKYMEGEEEIETTVRKEVEFKVAERKIEVIQEVLN